MNKNQIRADMKLFLTNLSPHERHERSLAACQKLLATREFKHAQTVMIFMSMPSEVETSPLAVKAWQEGKNVAVPRVDWAGKRMEPVEIKSLDVGMHTSAPASRRHSGNGRKSRMPRWASGNRSVAWWCPWRLSTWS